ncbi:protein polybromo-1 isoform X2 [Toxorhynchites rutilus septentrionalis]|uniref:protein polybromo-1 isoform X2 n=1 Tax=Toxorhynchites rutilus septentrionalis TaxID=329112 RepID=UPI00247B0411|nr:protein polybromo-1 isoform X2 [Toxorhynchites rutilus septentrionalis]
MSKRRRTSSMQEDDYSDDDSIPEQSPMPTSVRKKKKLDPSELCQQLYESIRSFKKEDGSTLCDTFIRAPKRRQEPSYYEVVANPIDLLKVQQKLKTEAYEDVDDLAVDVELIVKNAKAFYKPDSPEYQDACQLLDVFNANKSKLLESQQDQEMGEVRARKITRPRKSLTNDDEIECDDSDPYEELFNAVMTATDENRELHRMFQLLPSKKLYPDYYDIIDHPIDLKCIAIKIQTNAYSNLNEMEKDLLQMIKNACTFNEPGSQIYKDAKMLKRVFMTRKAEIEAGRYRKGANRKSRNGTSLSAMVAALKEEVETSDDDLDDSMETDGDGPLWQLFDQLYNTANTNDPNAVGAPLGESLWKLPNRRFHPEYYSLIKKPISMGQIRNKLKKGLYSNVTDMSADLYLMLDNAKKSNPPNSKVYKDAIKMQKLLNQKLIDSGDLEESDEEDDTDSSSIATAITPAKGNASKKGRPRSSTVSMQSPSQAAVQQGTSTPLVKSGNRQSLLATLKKKLLSLHEFLVEYTVNGRQPMSLFMEKPSKKLYPDYYQVIQHPMDMTTIESNMKSDRYGTLDDVVGDYRLMFSNCRKYNEEGSVIYEDANILEKALNEKLKEFSSISKRFSTPKVSRPRNKLNTLESKLKHLYDTVREYREPKANRQLSFIFVKLPSKNCSVSHTITAGCVGWACGKKKEYPDYYDIIKNPIDIERIEQKLRKQSYDSVDEMAADFMLMFENACKYNEPDSQIYKDALCLQQLVIQTKQALRSDETVPDVQQAIRELFLSLFTALYNYQDEEGRCYSDSLSELPEHDESTDGTKVRGISLDLIKRRLDKGLYKRLDLFQEDIFACLERARKLSRTDSQVFEDSIELQSFFIKKRDELCRHGKVLESPALSYNAMHLSASVEALRQTKLLEEQFYADTESDAMQPSQGESMTMDQKVYYPGDFVYIELPDNKIPGIMYIERLWTNNDNVKMMYGNMMLRPYETYHVQTRKFMQQEVFKSDQHQAVPLSQALNKCFVMHVKEYFKLRPEGFADKDVFVCESKYSSKGRFFKKIKTWNLVRANDPVILVPRDTPLEVKRVMSVFKERVEKHKEELSELQMQEAIAEKEKPNVVVYVNGGEEGSVYFEQYNTVCGGTVKTGDFVYVATESGKQSVAQVQSIWETKDGKSFCRGPWLLTPPEVPGTISRLFFRQEVLLSTVQETSPTVAIVGRCAVLEHHEYITRRPTEIAESDVLLCDSVYDELKKQIRKLGPGGLKKYNHSQMVTTDEIYHFRRPINPPKVTCGEIAALQENRPIPTADLECKDEFGIIDDSIDGPPSIGSDVVATASPVPPSTISTPQTASKKSNKTGKKLVTGYILYSCEHRKTICASNPEATFGEVSRIVGNEWRSLMDHEKAAWEQRASKMNEENAAKLAAEAGDTNCPSPAPTKPEGPIVQEIVANHVYECLWDKCDHQFEDPFDCMEHCITDVTGCVYKTFMKATEQEFSCIWRNCVRLRRNMPPFPHMQRLVKHVREVHLTKTAAKPVQPQDRGKNFVAAKRQSISQPHPSTIKPQPVPVAAGSPNISQSGASSSGATSSGSGTSTPLANQTQPVGAAAAGTSASNQSSNYQPAPFYNFVPAPPAEPLFVTVPPRPQRVLHSEAYIRYIEGLQSGSHYITPWQKTLTATRESIPNQDASRLPVHWLGKKGREKPEAVVDALWQLRGFLMKDVIQFNRF